MISKSVIIVVVGAAFLFACSNNSPPKAASSEETQAILAALIPHDPEIPICVSQELRPALQGQRQSAVALKKRSWVTWLKSTLSFSNESIHDVDWSQSGASGQMLRLQQEDARHLEYLLGQAVKADLPSAVVRIRLPDDVRACTKADERVDELGATPNINIYFSRPAIVGNVAFVERGGVCGNLCGSGSLVALIKRSGRWEILAQQMTWIA